MPIATVECFEAFFSATIRELIDSGAPYNENVANFNQAKNIKIYFEVLAAIQTKTLTIGEFVAHLLPYNNLRDISSNMTVITGSDFLTHLKNFEKESIFEVNNEITQDFQQRSAEILASVKRTYELRHIFCHEFGTNVSIDSTELVANFNNCKIFLEHANNYIWQLLYPGTPESQSEMNQNAHEQFETSQAKLDTLLSEILRVWEIAEDMDRFDYQSFSAALEHWNKYRDSFAAYSASCVEGGSMYPLLYSSALTSKTEEKIKSLEVEFGHLLKGIRTKKV